MQEKVPYIAETTRVKDSGLQGKYFLQPLTDIHLGPALNFDIAARHEHKYIYLFSSTALAVLFIACFNYMNLATGRARKRLKEIGNR